ncbi:MULTISPECIES: iron-sulfur cluster assembly accessory protein [unclassified Oceanobacter]|jgi:Fe-S cluster assembly protein SufA/iron-sulfur cluster assembly protein|uniref:HesB/IscA family protein n=1 Tax=unclassified Oceanobacter TaxID=2620260 RepID=UPI0026E32C1F|nr:MULTISPECIES: iron-sulfur cluster assembly accessory protein [unclassified Oceanobacter]MDO6682176.1 iron-sulfur cluster assembly accessory protein [Oceanobacter sp. 5_MG-2023]MDP2504909.1 iron-sulfur cluster assembly accessory protein [Oceanobacter sp. 3_MG-2023]MDP2546353.1 iron-sulfur cluster assembly accessory protein [Oceanobacter sp. 4_MG-2023]MDP2610560.1 iron-sulfur cluster assembly accessory protein [Oceanobacter sp. 1_MG-2023]MDP2613831.1 iron-sulfur cluster assembly accessory pro
MSIETYDPNAAADVSMTAAAIQHIRNMLAKNSDKTGVRLAVKKSGCSGFKYDIDFVDAPSDGDQIVQVASDVTLYVAADARSYVRGTEIDFTKEGLNSIIKFNNPNARDLCGCGESFSV